jgi:hypothetical protein
VPDRTPEFEVMCNEVVELRSHAARLEDQTRAVELRLLGPTPSEEPATIAVANTPYLTGVVGADVKIARKSLFAVEYSLDRIRQELGKVGQE